MIRQKCKCHNVSMYWNKDKRNKNGGFWTCRIKRRQYDEAHRRKNGIKPANPKTEKYLKNGKMCCKCHDVEMLWHKDTKRKTGGYWICRMKDRERKIKWSRKNGIKPTNKATAIFKNGIAFCNCHDVEMYFKDNCWQCIIKMRKSKYRYSQTNKGRESRKRYNKSEKRRAYENHRRNDPKYKFKKSQKDTLRNARKQIEIVTKRAEGLYG